MLSVRTTHRQINRSRFWIYGLLWCVFFRALIPIGFMAGSDPHAWITLCYGNAGSVALLNLAESEHEHHHHSGHSPEQTDAHNHQQAISAHNYCLFASVSLNSPQPAATSPIPTDPAKAAPPTAQNHYLPRTDSFRPQFPRAPPTHRPAIA